MQPKNWKWWPIPLLLAEALVFFRHVLFWPLEYVVPWDFQYYAFNQETFLTESLRAGHFPLWDPYTYCGMAFFTNIQSQVFYPPTLIASGLAILVGTGHLRSLLIWELVLHIFLAAVFTYWLLRELCCSRLAAFTGATALQFGCYFASQTQHFGAITGSAWLPLSVLAVVKLARGFSTRWVAALALSLAMPILAGYPSTICAAFLCSLFLAVGLVVNRTGPARLLLRYAAGAAGGILLAAIQLLPTIQIATMSVSKYRGDWRSYGSGLRLEALPSLIWPNTYHILDLRGYSLPYNFTFLYLYCGLVTLGLAALALIRKRPEYAAPFSILTAASAVMMFGDSLPLGRWLLPFFFDLTRDTVYPEFFMVGFSLGIAVLCGLGANKLSSRPMMLAGLSALLFIDLFYAGSGRPMNTRRTRDEPGITRTHFDGSTQILETVRGLVHRDYPPSRLETYADAMGWTSMAPTIEIPTPNGNDPFALIPFMNVRRLFCGGQRWGRYYQVREPDSPILDLLNVRYLVTRRPLPENAKYRLAATVPGHLLYENLRVLPRFFLVRRTAAAGSMDEALGCMRSPEFHPGEVAVVQGAPAREYPEGDNPPVRVERYDQNEVAVVTDAARERFLVTSEAMYPGWEAYIDGARAPIVLTNAAFRGLQIPAGHHRVVFRFRPQILWWGAGLSAIALIACCWAVRRPTR